MLWTPAGSGDFGVQVSNVDGVRPAGVTGTNVVNGAANTKGSYVQVLSSANVAFDVFGLYVSSNALGLDSTLMDVGVDPAGGTAYSVLVPNLLISDTANLTSGGLSYYFPIWVKSGSSVAVRTQGTIAGNSSQAIVRAYGKPRDASLTWVGTYCTDFGTDLVNSTGTAVTSGTAAEGAWTSLATSISKDYRHWQVGFGLSTGALASNVYTADLAYGDGSNKIITIQDQIFYTTTQTGSLATGGRSPGCGRLTKNGNNVYGRLQCSGTPDTGTTMIAYGVG